VVLDLDYLFAALAEESLQVWRVHLCFRPTDRLSNRERLRLLNFSCWLDLGLGAQDFGFGLLRDRP
jgi:hypothetical protein